MGNDVSGIGYVVSGVVGGVSGLGHDISHTGYVATRVVRFVAL
jgi:hypothetical protein